MKKLFTLLTLAAASLTPLSPLRAQSSPPSAPDVWQTLGQLASLENAQSLETIYGNVVVGDFTVNYNVEVKSKANNTDDEMRSASVIDATVSILNEGDMDFAAAFEQMDVRLEGEMLVQNDDFYMKLKDLALNAEGGDEEVNEEMQEILAFIAPVKGNWYHFDLNDPESLAPGWSMFGQKEFLQNFKNDPKMAVKSLVKTVVTEQVRQEQYFDHMFGDYDVPTVDILESAIEEDYQTYMSEELRKHPIDLNALVEKGALECEADAYKAQDLANGFQHPGCWPSISYTGPLTEVEEKLMDQIYANNGSWVFENGKWYYVEFYALKEGVLEEKEVRTYDDVVTPEEFDYDQKAIDEKVAQTMKGIDVLLNADLFHEREIVLGPNKGFQFYTLNRGNAWHALKMVSEAMKEKMDSYEEDALWETLLRVKFGGNYNIREDNGLMDNFFVRLRYQNEQFLDHFEINYKFELTDWTSENAIQIPSEAKEVQDLDVLLENVF